MDTRLERFTLKARQEPQTRFNALMGLLFDPEGLRESFERQDGTKAPGVDGMRKEQYGTGLDERLAELSGRLRRLGYRPKPVRQTYLPKGDGRFRPLGIPSFEDRLVQDRLSRILQAIWEPEFRECSYGFRPGRGAHDALQRVPEVITNGGTQWVVEADIKGFFDHLSHAHMVSFLEHRRPWVAAHCAAVPQGGRHGRRRIRGQRGGDPARGLGYAPCSATFTCTMCSTCGSRSALPGDVRAGRT